MNRTQYVNVVRDEYFLKVDLSIRTGSFVIKRRNEYARLNECVYVYTMCVIRHHL